MGGPGRRTGRDVYKRQDEKRSSPELRGYVKERIRKMQDVMARKGVDVTILMRPENVFYFSNFNPILISHVPYLSLIHISRPPDR